MPPAIVRPEQARDGLFFVAGNRLTFPASLVFTRGGPRVKDAAMLVSTEQLASRLNDPAWVIFDCRHDLTDHGKGARLYRESHLPGAHFAAVESDLSGAKNGKNGRHPLPAPEAFGAFLARQA